VNHTIRVSDPVSLATVDETSHRLCRDGDASQHRCPSASQRGLPFTTSRCGNPQSPKSAIVGNQIGLNTRRASRKELEPETRRSRNRDPGSFLPRVPHRPGPVKKCVVAWERGAARLKKYSMLRCKGDGPRPARVVCRPSCSMSRFRLGHQHHGCDVVAGFVRVGGSGAGASSPFLVRTVVDNLRQTFGQSIPHRSPSRRDPSRCSGNGTRFRIVFQCHLELRVPAE